HISMQIVGTVVGIYRVLVVRAVFIAIQVAFSWPGSAGFRGPAFGREQLRGLSDHVDGILAGLFNGIASVHGFLRSRCTPGHHGSTAQESRCCAGSQM